MTTPFKTAVISDEISQDLEIALGLAREFQLYSVEIRGAWGKGPQDLTADDLARAAGLVQAAGMTVCGVAPPLFKCELDDTEAVTEHLGILRRSAAAAHALGTDKVRGFAFWKHGPLEDRKARIVPHLKEAARIAEGEGVIIGLENEYATANNNVRRTLELLEAVDSPAMRLLYDPGNDVHDEEHEPAWPDSYELARGRIFHMHLKDPKRDPATDKVTTVAIGDGDVHVEDLLRALIGDGYDGTISLETHYRRDPLPHEVARLPQGEDFSAGGYVATRECLENWFAILERIAGPSA
jgi:sugar phosphate isomerase/epimerase